MVVFCSIILQSVRVKPENKDDQQTIEAVCEQIRGIIKLSKQLQYSGTQGQSPYQLIRESRIDVIGVLHFSSFSFLF